MAGTGSDQENTSSPFARPLHAAAMLLAALGIAGLLATAAACERKGPAERSGEAVDEAVEDTGRAIDDALD